MMLVNLILFAVLDMLTAHRAGHLFVLLSGLSPSLECLISSFNQS